MPSETFYFKGKTYSLDDVLIEVFESLQTERVRLSLEQRKNHTKLYNPNIDENSDDDVFGRRYTGDISILNRHLTTEIINSEFFRLIGGGYVGFLEFVPESLSEVTMDHIIKFLSFIFYRENQSWGEFDHLKRKW